MSVEAIEAIFYTVSGITAVLALMGTAWNWKTHWIFLPVFIGVACLALMGQIGWMLLYMLVIGCWYFIFWSRRRPVRNALGWVHPDKGGGIIIFENTPHTLKPYKIFYDWWSLRAKPIWLWHEEKTDDGYKWEPYEPEARSIIIADQPDVKDNIIYIPTPRQLWNNADWQCGRDFETLPSKVVEAIKMGMSIAMVAICVIGTFFIIDLMQKGGS